MAEISLDEKKYKCMERETVLNALIRQNARVRFSCKKGVCKTCRLELVEGEVPRAATRAFEHLDENYFLPCLSVIQNDIVIAYPRDYEFPEQPKALDYEHLEEANHDKPVPDLSLYHRVMRDDLLINVLTSFYEEVYNDELLSPYFAGIHKGSVIGKQYNFLIMLFSGVENYLGARPRNAHHWMVISNDMFDYREKMMERHMRFHGLEEEFVERWMAMHEFYRTRMVKDKPWHRIQDGHSFPLEGLGDLKAEVGMVCDNCQRIVEVGEHLKYHLHTGQVYCNTCSA